MDDRVDVPDLMIFALRQPCRTLGPPHPRDYRSHQRSCWWLGIAVGGKAGAAGARW